MNIIMTILCLFTLNFDISWSLLQYFLVTHHPVAMEGLVLRPTVDKTLSVYVRVDLMAHNVKGKVSLCFPTIAIYTVMDNHGHKVLYP